MSSTVSFKYRGEFYSTQSGKIPELMKFSGKQKVSSILFVNNKINIKEINADKFMLKKSSLDVLSREAYKFLDKEEYEEKIMKRKIIQKNYDIKRIKTSERKEYLRGFDRREERKINHRKLDKVRDQDEKRKIFHRNIDEVRNQEEERKKYNQKIDQVRNQEEERKKYNKKIDKVRDQDEKRKTFHRNVDK